MYLTRSWPRLSQTFIVGEVLALERLGADLEIVALTASGEALRQAQVDDVRAPVTCLNRASPDSTLRDHLLVAEHEPRRYADTARFARANPGLAAGYAKATTGECFRLAVQVAARCLRLAARGAPVTHLHAHFAHDPALVAHLVGRLTGVPYSITAHARDLYQIPVQSLRARASAATSVLTCCHANRTYLEAHLAPADVARVRVVHHGVDLRRLMPGPARPDGGTVRIVSVGRLVEKKGFPDLLRAFAAVAAGRDVSLTVYGDGPLRADLEALRDRLGLHGVVTFAGERSNDRVVEALRRSDVFALTPFVTADGDRDGVPNVIVEALACALPVVATTAGGIAEAVQDRVNGLLAEPHEVAAVAAGLATLADDAALRRTMGARARRSVEESFDVDRAARELAGVFGLGRAA